MTQNELIASLSDDGVCIIKFESKSCAHCKFWDRIIDGVLKNVGKEIPVKHIDAEENKEYADIMGITDLPYIIIADAHNSVREFIGAPSKADKDAFIAALNSVVGHEN